MTRTILPQIIKAIELILLTAGLAAAGATLAAPVDFAGPVPGFGKPFS